METVKLVTAVLGLILTAVVVFAQANTIGESLLLHGAR